MKKLNFWLLGSLFVGAFALSACSSSDSDEKGGGPNSPLIQDGTPVNPANMKMSALSGFVKDPYGDPLSGVTVTSGTEVVRTDGSGGFVLSKVNTKNGRTVVKFEKDGYMEIVRAAEKLDGDVWDVVMVSQWDGYVTTGSFSSSTNTYSTDQGMTVALQGNGFKVDGNGQAFTGTVYEQMMYLNPDKENFAEMMPGGDLAAVRTDVNGAEYNGQEVQLISYGMTKVDLTDQNTGEKLQLADGKPATLTFPVPEKFKDSKPNTIPLWSFDESNGLWVEEGIATYDASNDVYVGTVTHFSWVNLDYPEVRVRLTVIVKDDKGNLLPGIKVDIDAQKNVTTNVKGQASTYVPKDTEFYVTVHSEDYANYDGSVKETVSPMTKDGTITIVLPTVAHISGNVVNQGEGNNVATVWIEYNGNQTKKVHTDVDGQFFIIAPADYTGKAKLKVRGADGSVKTAEIELDGKDHAYTINFSSDINAGGTGKFVLKGQTYNFTFGEVNVENEGGAIIVDNMFSANTGYPSEDEGRDGFVMAMINLSNYSDGKTSFTLGESDRVSMQSEGEGGYMNIEFVSGNATISQKANSYNIKVSGKARAQGGEWGWNETDDNIGDATLEITVPLYARAKRLKDVTAANNPLPSFAPTLNGPADFGLSVTESVVVGKGGVLMYFADSLSMDDYNTLKAKAIEKMGEPVYDNTYSNSASAEFFKDGKWLEIGFNDYYKQANRPDFMDSNREFSPYNLTYAQGRITVIAYDGYTVYGNGSIKIKKRK